MKQANKQFCNFLRLNRNNLLHEFSLYILQIVYSFSNLEIICKSKFQLHLRGQFLYSWTKKRHFDYLPSSCPHSFWITPYSDRCVSHYCCISNKIPNSRVKVIITKERNWRNWSLMLSSLNRWKDVSLFWHNH